MTLDPVQTVAQHRNGRAGPARPFPQILMTARS